MNPRRSFLRPRKAGTRPASAALAILLALSGSSPLGAAIDFSPTTAERELEGVVFKQLRFHENGRALAYEQPIGWTYFGGGASIRFLPPEVSQAFAEIQQSPQEVELNFEDEEVTKGLVAQVLASLPEDATDAAVAAEEKSPVTVAGLPTYEIVVGYNLNGQPFQLSVLYANFPGTQVRFCVSAKANDFPALHRLFRGSLCSFHWL